ncbi:MAG: hypothetical protein ACPIOQ_36830, partial [Promethearchaeia archaeon]
SAMEEKLEKQRGQFEAAVDGTRGELMDKIEEVTSTVETVVGAVSVSVEQASEAVVASVETARAQGHEENKYIVAQNLVHANLTAAVAQQAGVPALAEICTWPRCGCLGGGYRLVHSAGPGTTHRR